MNVESPRNDQSQNFDATYHLEAKEVKRSPTQMIASLQSICSFEQVMGSYFQICKILVI